MVGNDGDQGVFDGYSGRDNTKEMVSVSRQFSIALGLSRIRKRLYGCTLPHSVALTSSLSLSNKK